VKRSISSSALIVALLMFIASVAIHAGKLQPTRISEVGQLIATSEIGGTSYPFFRYEGIGVRGDMLLGEYREAIALVRSNLQPNEHMQTVVAQQTPAERIDGKDLEVRTCTKDCGVIDGGEGRMFILERVNGVLELFTIRRWIG
jgi:hypothetical protein